MHMALQPRRSEDTVKSLVLYKKLLGVEVPRELRVGSERSVFVFTDASYEPEHPSWQAGLGSVLCSKKVRSFSTSQSMLTLRSVKG